MHELVLTPEAFDDIWSARQWYDEQSEGMGSEFDAAIGALMRTICRNPQAFPEVGPAIHRALLRRFPYKVFYTFDEQRVFVALVLHNARDPAIALKRLRSH
jgi:toxin ParE1/3/4